MGWLALLVFAILTGVGLWRFGRMPRAALELSGAALLIGVAGYASQANPSLSGSPVSPPDSAPLPASEEAMIKNAPSKLTAESQWLDLADALIRSGHVQSAVSIIGGGLQRSPNNPDLWVGLGNAF